MLTVRDHMALRIAGAQYARSGRREDDALELVGMTAPRFAQMVNGLIDRPDAEAAHPEVVRRLRRLREARAKARGATRGAASRPIAPPATR